MTSIVIVEDRAQMPLGHFPGEFAELADGFVALGLDVDVLTRRGWALEGSRARGWTLHVAGPLADRLLGVARRAMATSGYFAGRSDRGIGLRTSFGIMLRTVVLIISARRIARSGSGGRSAIIVVGMDFMPALLSLFGGGDRWLIWQFSPEIRSSWLAAGIERVRRVLRRPPRQFVLAVHDEHWIRTVGEQLPGYRVVSIPLIGTRRVRTDRDAARGTLGLDTSAKVAVMFGAGHPEQAPQTVVDAFRRRPDWQLLIGGRVCTKLDRDELAQWQTPPMLFEGFLEESIREELFGAADLAVTSFVAEYRLRSGTVMDAASHGLPILVSAGSLAADLVRETCAGELFEAESSQSLLEALDRIDLDRSREGSERLREMNSATVICRAHLDALG